jgi:ubiquinone/menaquinone biosynthesis C-methylase UbiE
MLGHSGWQLSSLSVAEAYERYIMATFGDAFARLLVEGAAPRAGERVLDVACGTGAVARAAVRRVGPSGRVVGLDLNPAMLAMAQAIPGDDGVIIEWQEADATVLPFGDAAFDLVLCHQGLQFIPDRATALREMHRVLVPSGRLGLGVWRRLERQPFYAALVESLGQHLGAQTADSLRAAFTLGDAPQLRALVAGAGFRKIHVRIQSRLTRYPSLDEFVLGYLSGTPMAPAITALNESGREAMLGQIRGALRDYVDDDGLAAPWESHLLTAQT